MSRRRDVTGEATAALTRREREIATLVADGLTNREIARRSFISERTVDGHLEHIREKLGFNSRAQIAAWVVGQSQGVPAPGTPANPGNLPERRTSFIGREPELQEIHDALQRSRMVTLTGAGGCGKTRLALEAGRSMKDAFPDGAWLAELAPLADLSLVPGAVGAVMGVHDDPGRPFMELLIESLDGMRMLLVLDNCEHVLDAASELCDQLLARCPSIRVLATSREALGVEGERNLPISALGVPVQGASADDIASSEAGRLFLDRARAVMPTFQVTDSNAGEVRSICQRLDGMPLAIELAAARVGFLTPRQIDQRLDDRFRLLNGTGSATLPRHRTLRALIDWSHDLLTEDEAVLYRRLAVFVGGCTLEAAEYVCPGGSLEAADVLDCLGRLVQKSLVVADAHDGRYRYAMLETIRAHALERLRASGESDGPRQRHAQWVIAFMEESEVALSGPQQIERARQVALDFANLRAAFTWALAAGDVDSAIRMATNRRVFQVMQGHGAEIRAWLDDVLGRADAATPSMRARALAQAGEFRRLTGELGVARAYLEEALSQQRRLADPTAVGRTLYMLGRVELAAGRNSRAYALTEESVGIARDGGDLQPVGERLAQLGEVIYGGPSPERAEPVLLEALREARSAGDSHSIADSLRILGMVARDGGRLEEARSFLEQALDLQRGLADTWCAALSLSAIGDLELLAGRPAQARTLFAESLASQRTLGDSNGMADSLWGLAGAAALEGSWAQAAHLLGAEEAMRPAGTGHFRIASAERHEFVLTALQQQMTGAALDAALREGRERALADAHPVPEDL